MAYKRISPIPVTEGGVGAQSFTAYSVICAGTTSTGAFQNVSGVGTSGQVLTSAGGGLLPTWSTLATSITTIAGTTGTATGSTVTFTGSTSGAIFTASGSTVTQSFNFLALPDTNSGATVGYISFNGTRFISDFGTNNTFVGKSSGNATSSGTGGNTAIGASALPAITTAVENTAVGYGALLSATSSSFNTAVGLGALSLNSTGNGRNVAVGDGAGGSITTGDYNIYLGTLAGSGHTSTETGNIDIGNVGTATDANTTRIGTQGTGSGQQNKCFIAGIVGVTTSNTQMVTINSSTGQLGAAAVPGNPAAGCTFFAYADTTQTVNAGVNDTVVFGTEDIDIGSNFASNTFTVPTSSKLYYFSTSIAALYASAGDFIGIYKNGNLVAFAENSQAVTAFYVSTNASVILSLTAGDLITVHYQNNGAIGATVGGQAGANGYLSWFMGYQLT